MNTDDALSWKRESLNVVWHGNEIMVPGPLLWAAELPDRTGFAVVTLFDEETPLNLTNAFIYRPSGRFQPVTIFEKNTELVRFLGCYPEGDRIVFNAANDTEYLIDPDTRETRSTRYYR